MTEPIEPISKAEIDVVFKLSYGMVKYVKVGGEYRFTYKTSDHSSLIKAGEKASSAGFISWDTGKSGKKFMRILDESSMSLGWLGPDAEDGRAIADLLGFDLITNSCRDF